MKQPNGGRERAWPWIGAVVLIAVAAAFADSAAEITTTPVNLAETSTDRETLPVPGESRPTDSAAVDASVPSVATAGVRAFIDPETGRLTANPTRAQLQRLTVQQRSSTLGRSTLGLRPFELSRGGRGLNLDGRFQSAMRVERGADGSFHVICGDGAAHEEAPVQ